MPTAAVELPPPVEGRPRLTLPEPDWLSPTDLDLYVRSTPPGLFVKGMSFSGILEALQEMGKPLPGPPTYVGFKDYPEQEFVALLARAARESLGHLPPREALRRLGFYQLGKLKENLVFRVLFAGLWQTQSISAAAKIIPKAYAAAAAAKHEEWTLKANEPRRILLGMRNVWSFPESFQVGLMEGALHTFGLSAQAGVRLTSLCDAELEFVW